MSRVARRQVGLAPGVAAVLDVGPDVSGFHRTWPFPAARGLAGGPTLVAIGADRRPVAAYATSRSREREADRHLTT